MRRRLLNEKRSLDIQKLEYIQSTGTQLIDTGYIPKINTVLEMDIQFVKNKYEHAGSLPQGTANAFFGCNDGSICFFANFGGRSQQDKEIFFWNDNSYSDGGKIKTMSCGISMYNRNVMRIERNKVQYVSELSLQPKSQNHKNRTLYLFGINAESPEGKVATFIRHDLRMFACKIYEDGVILKDFIPARCGESAGLYDLVAEKFHENIGTGGFLYG